MFQNYVLDIMFIYAQLILITGNVAAAITKSDAGSVDTASGVEADRGTKSATLISQFSENALASLRPS